MTERLTVDELARATGVSARTIRAYVERGILPSPRLVGRTGYYGDVHVERVVVIRRLQRHGFSLASVRFLLDAWHGGASLDELLSADPAHRPDVSATDRAGTPESPPKWIAQQSN